MAVEVLGQKVSGRLLDMSLIVNIKGMDRWNSMI